MATLAVEDQDGCRDLAELLNATETGGVRNAEDMLKDDELVDANREKCIKASEENVHCVGEVHEL